MLGQFILGYVAVSLFIGLYNLIQIDNYGLSNVHIVNGITAFFFPSWIEQILFFGAMRIVKAVC